MKNTQKYIASILILGLVMTLSSCFKDLDVIPLDTKITTSATVYDDPSTYKSVLAKLYAGLAVSGQEGPAGQSDISGIDEGFGQYLRGYWYHQEFSTDEALVGWNDQTIKDFHGQSWTSDDAFIFALYSRIYYQIALCNEFIRETSEAKLDERNVEGSLRDEINGFRAEARFLRSLSYWHALDLFRNVPFVTEEDAVGQFFPEQILAADLFNYIESELTAIETEIAPARSNEYGRADQAAVWTLLAKLYLNAEVYTGTERFQSCIEYCDKVIGAGYTLEPNYQHLFLTDNHNSNEIIFPIAFDGINTRTWGGMTFIIRAGIGGIMDPTASGVVSGWGGVRTTKELVNKFPEIGGLLIEASEGNTVSYPKVYVPGSFQGFDYSDTNNALSSVESDQNYEGYKYFPEDNTEFFITKIPSESAPFFGDNGGDGTLEQFGDPIVAGEAGLYRITANLNDNTYAIERTEWSIIGDAAIGWENDVPLVWDEELQALHAVVDLIPGEFKFRANGDWNLNLGDTEGNGILTQDGNNIIMNQNGTFQVTLFLNRPDYTYEVKFNNFDNRAVFWSEGQNLEINDVTMFTDGWAVTKFKNISSTGEPGSDSDFPDTDFPMFRLADVYLMASEAIFRASGDVQKATDYFNEVRMRAYGGSSTGNISAPDLDLELLLDERALELYWECHRRTDLVRHGQFTNGDYLWAWKGNSQEGVRTEEFRDVYPIPSSDIGANPNLIQNEGY